MVSRYYYLLLVDDVHAVGQRHRFVALQLLVVHNLSLRAADGYPLLLGRHQSDVILAHVEVEGRRGGLPDARWVDLLVHTHPVEERGVGVSQVGGACPTAVANTLVEQPYK
mgnify:CR=1 FL=1